MVALIILFDINSRNIFSGRQVKLEGRTDRRKMLSEVADRPSSRAGKSKDKKRGEETFQVSKF